MLILYIHNFPEGFENLKFQGFKLLSMSPLLPLVNFNSLLECQLLLIYCKKYLAE